MEHTIKYVGCINMMGWNMLKFIVDGRQWHESFHSSTISSSQDAIDQGVFMIKQRLAKEPDYWLKLVKIEENDND